MTSPYKSQKHRLRDMSALFSVFPPAFQLRIKLAVILISAPADLPPLHGLLHGAVRLVDVGAARKAAPGLPLPEFRKKAAKLLLLYTEKLDGAEARGIHDPGSLPDADQLRMSGGMSPPFDPADLARLHGHAVLQFIDERGFTHAAGSCHRRCPALQELFQLSKPLLRDRAGKDHRIAAGGIAVIKAFAGFFIRKILFIKADAAGNALLLHGDEKSVHQVQVRLGADCSHDDERLIHIRHGRADERAASGQDRAHISLLLFLVYDVKFHIISGKGLFPVLPEDPLRPAFVQYVRGLRQICLPPDRLRSLLSGDRCDIIEARDSSDYSSSHVPESFLINVIGLLMVLCSEVPGTVVTSPVFGSVTVAASAVTV